MDERNDIRDVNISATTAIYKTLKPYHKSGAISDQDWVYVCLMLKKIEHSHDKEEPT